MHVGAPAGGVNAATRIVVRLGLAHGHTVLGVRDGFRGLSEGHLAEMTWMSVDGWSNRGGSELGTNRVLPNEHFGEVAAQLQKHNIHALCVMGGWEAMIAVNQLVRGGASARLWAHLCVCRCIC